MRQSLGTAAGRTRPFTENGPASQESHVPSPANRSVRVSTNGSLDIVRQTPRPWPARTIGDEKCMAECEVAAGRLRPFPRMRLPCTELTDRN